MALVHFLVIYDRRKGKLIRLDRFGDDAEAATQAYAEVEAEYRDRPDHQNFEIVLIGADSLDTLKVTHSRYFADDVRLPFAV